MPISKITRQGLAAIAVSVALLWICLIGQRLAAREAFAERARVMRELQRSPGREAPRPARAPSAPEPAPSGAALLPQHA